MPNRSPCAGDADHRDPAALAADLVTEPLRAAAAIRRQESTEDLQVGFCGTCREPATTWGPNGLTECCGAELMRTDPETVA